MICACIDIGSNTTRLLVADAGQGRLRELVAQRAFTRIGKSIQNGGPIPPEKIAETAGVVRTQTSVAREVGAEHIVAVATAAIRTAPNRDELVDAVEDAGGVELSVLSGEEEARLSFVGATRTLLEAPISKADADALTDEYDATPPPACAQALDDLRASVKSIAEAWKNRAGAVGTWQFVVELMKARRVLAEAKARCFGVAGGVEGVL